GGRDHCIAIAFCSGMSHAPQGSKNEKITTRNNRPSRIDIADENQVSLDFQYLPGANDSCKYFMGRLFTRLCPIALDRLYDEIPTIDHVLHGLFLLFGDLAFSELYMNVHQRSAEQLLMCLFKLVLQFLDKLRERAAVVKYKYKT